MAEDGLDDLFELVEGIETGMTEAQKRRVMREEGIGQDEYEEMMAAAAHDSAADKPQKKRRRDEEKAEDEDGESEQEGMRRRRRMMISYCQSRMPQRWSDTIKKTRRRNKEMRMMKKEEEEEGESEDDAEQNDEEDQHAAADSEDNEEHLDDMFADDLGDNEQQQDDQPAHRKLTRDELYGFNAPTPQSLIDYKQGNHPTATANTTITSASSITPTKYIPPHLRNKTTPTTTPTATTTATTAQQPPTLLSTPPVDTTLLPRITGLLNRLNEQNVEPITSQLLPLFDSFSRQSVNNTLTSAILLQLVGGTAASVASTFVLSTSGLLFLLHYTEEHATAAYLLEHTLLTLHNVLSAASTAGGTAALSAAGVNVVGLLCHLYLFGVTSSTVLFDLLTFFASTLTLPLHIELLTTIISTTGLSLRKTNPSALKENYRHTTPLRSTTERCRALRQSRLPAGGW